MNEQQKTSKYLSINISSKTKSHRLSDGGLFIQPRKRLTWHVIWSSYMNFKTQNRAFLLPFGVGTDGVDDEGGAATFDGVKDFDHILGDTD